MGKNTHFFIDAQGRAVDRAFVITMDSGQICNQRQLQNILFFQKFNGVRKPRSLVFVNLIQDIRR